MDFDHIGNGGAFLPAYGAYTAQVWVYVYTFQFVIAKVGVRDQDAADIFSTFFNEGFANGASLQFSSPVAEGFWVARRSIV